MNKSDLLTLASAKRQLDTTVKSVASKDNGFQKSTQRLFSGIRDSLLLGKSYHIATRSEVYPNDFVILRKLGYQVLEDIHGVKISWKTGKLSQKYPKDVTAPCIDPKNAVWSYIKDINGHIHGCVVVLSSGKFGISVKHPEDQPCKNTALWTAYNRALMGKNIIPRVPMFALICTSDCHPKFKQQEIHRVLTKMVNFAIRRFNIDYSVFLELELQTNHHVYPDFDFEGKFLRFTY